MTKVFERYMRTQKNILWFAVGLAAVLVMAVPYLVLGQGAIVTYHDQLDGELIAYLLQARHLFGGDMLPEFLGGMDKTALVPPAPGFVLLFRCMSPFAALVFMQMTGSICGYIGMYLLISDTTGKCDEKASDRAVVSFVAMVVGVLYAYLPFLPVYGLSQYGLPLLVWCVWQLLQGKHTKAAYIYGIVYALCSSLVLIGFGVLGCMAVWMAVQLIRTKKCRSIGPALILWGAMIVVYIAENWGLLRQTLMGGTASHKSEYVLAVMHFDSEFISHLLQGGQHSADYHYLFGGVVLVVFLLCLCLKREKAFVRLTCLGLICIVSWAGISALWDSAAGLFIRNHLSALGAFQLNRLMWLAPFMWYLLLGASAVTAYRLVTGDKGILRYAGMACCALLVLCVGLTGVKILLASNLKPNIQKLRNPGYAALSFEDYYAIGVLEQVRDYIEETTGESPEEYRVVSLGIDPAATLYHGFYCLDGYSNNYSLEYKHRFREILEPELEKSEYLRSQFDGWGNRCYLFGAECPGYFTIEKGGFTFQDYTLNTESLKELGGKYLLSAAYIMNAEEQGLTLVREDEFETGDSYYCIYLYAVTGTEGTGT